jgi:hypothetical protein
MKEVQLPQTTPSGSNNSISKECMDIDENKNNITL